MVVWPIWTFGMMSEVKTLSALRADRGGGAHGQTGTLKAWPMTMSIWEFSLKTPPDTDLTPIIPALSEVFSNALGAQCGGAEFSRVLRNEFFGSDVRVSLPGTGLLCADLFALW